jgi:hypothetical protein
MSPAAPASGESAPAPAPAESATADWYRHFGTVDAPGNSACYAAWAVGIAEDAALIQRIAKWPYNKRQPLLMLAAARFLGARISPYREFRQFLDVHWSDFPDRPLPRHPDQRGRTLRHTVALAGQDFRRRGAAACAYRSGHLRRARTVPGPLRL